MENLVVSLAGHLALRLNAQEWHREANVVLNVPARLCAREKKRDTRTEKPAPFDFLNFGQRAQRPGW